MSLFLSVTLALLVALSTTFLVATGLDLIASGPGSFGLVTSIVAMVWVSSKVTPVP